MIKVIEIENNIKSHNDNVYKINFTETKRRGLFISRFINENFGEGRFYSKLKSYGTGSFCAGDC